MCCGSYGSYGSYGFAVLRLRFGSSCPLGSQTPTLVLVWQTPYHFAPPLLAPPLPQPYPWLLSLTPFLLMLTPLTAA